MNLNISAQDREDLVLAVQMRIGVIETGDPTLRASDAINMGQPKLVKALQPEQRELIARQEALIGRLLATR